MNQHNRPAWQRPRVLMGAGVVVAAVAVGGFLYLDKDDSTEYCSELGAWDDRTDEQLAPGTTEEDAYKEISARLVDSIETYEGFAKTAPDDVRDDWQLYSERWSNVFVAAEEQGFDLTDPASLRREPSAEAQAKVTEASSALSRQDAKDALDHIVEHARDTCDLDISKLGQ